MYCPLCLSHLSVFVSVQLFLMLIQRALPRANMRVYVKIYVLQNVGLLPKYSKLSVFSSSSSFILLTLYNSYFISQFEHNTLCVHCTRMSLSVCMCVGRLNWNCERPALCVCVYLLGFFFIVSFFTEVCVYYKIELSV